MNTKLKIGNSLLKLPRVATDNRIGLDIIIVLFSLNYKNLNNNTLLKSFHTYVYKFHYKLNMNKILKRA